MLFFQDRGQVCVLFHYSQLFHNALLSTDFSIANHGDDKCKQKQERETYQNRSHRKMPRKYPRLTCHKLHDHISHGNANRTADDCRPQGICKSFILKHALLLFSGHAQSQYIFYKNFSCRKSKPTIAKSVDNSPLFQTIQHMRNRKHQSLIMHIVKNIFIHQNLQTCRKILIGFPKPQNQWKKWKQVKFICNISLVQFSSLKSLTCTS